MKTISLLFFIVVLSVPAHSQGKKTDQPAFKIDQYWFVMIKTGPKSDFDSSARAELFKGHMANMERLHADGILKAAGPFGKNELRWRGIFILDCKTKEDAEKYVSTDPAIAAGLFAADIIPWFTEPSGNFMHGKPKKEQP
jgi:uncharacterized protein YciI